MNARIMFTSGMWSYAPPVWPVSPLASETAVKKTIASRQSWMLCCNVAFCSGVSVVRVGSSLSGLSADRSIGNFSFAAPLVAADVVVAVAVVMRRGNILGGGCARKRYKECGVFSRRDRQERRVTTNEINF